MEIILLLEQLIFYVLTFIFRNKIKIKKILLAVFQVIIFYVTLLIIVKIIDLRLEKELYSFDLNHDGVFSGSEICPEQELAMKAFIQDTGRTFAPITGAFFSLIYFPFAYIIEIAIEKMHHKVNK